MKEKCEKYDERSEREKDETKQKKGSITTKNKRNNFFTITTKVFHNNIQNTFLTDKCLIYILF